MTVVRRIGAATARLNAAAAAKAIGNSGVSGGWMNGRTDGRTWQGRARLGRPVLNHRTDMPTDRPNGSVVGRRHYVLFGT